MQTIKQRKQLHHLNRRPQGNNLVGRDVRLLYGDPGTIESVEGRWFGIKLKDGRVRRFLREQFKL